MGEVLKPGTLKNYSATEKYLSDYLLKDRKTSDIYLKNTSYQFVTGFDGFLRRVKDKNGKKQLSNNGVMKHLERFKKLLNLAIKLGWMEKNPFRDYKMKFEKFDRAYLNKRDNVVKGINGKNWLYCTREKSQTPMKIPLLDKASDILNRYLQLETFENLLPIYCNQKTNNYLKEIGAQCKISKNLSFHVARHTFATTVTLSNGVPIETVSKLLGHSKLSTTQIYARVIDQKIGDDMDLLQSKLS
jgi:hypothetical protein